MDRLAQMTERYFLLLLIDAVKYAHLSLDETIDPDLERSYSRSSVLTSTILLECLANVLIDEIPSSKLKDDLEKLPFLSKVDVYLLFKRLSILDRGSEVVQRAAELKTLRDAFVHPKKRKHSAQRDESTDEIRFNIGFTSHPQTGISHTPGTWRNKDCIVALKASLDFARHLLVNKLSLSADGAFSKVCSDFQVGGNRAILSETELERTRELARTIKIDLSFILPMPLPGAT